MSTPPVGMLSRGRRDSLVLLLAWAAGSVDAIGFLGLGHVFTANMTGNTVLLGLSLGEGRGIAAVANVIALAGFCLGVALGAVIVERDARKGEWDRPVTAALGKLHHVPIKMERDGTTIVLYAPELDKNYETAAARFV